MVEFVTSMARAAMEGRYHFLPVELFNETWLTRLVLAWFAEHRDFSHPWSFHEGSSWYSQAVLPSAFSAMQRGDVLAEGHVRIDAAVGQFDVEPTAGILRLTSRCTQFLVLSRSGQLALGTTNAPWFDQITRTVAAITETLVRARIGPAEIECLGMYLISTEKASVAKRALRTLANKERIAATLRRRVSLYRNTSRYDELQEWATNWFEPVLSAMTIDGIAWGEVISSVCQRDPASRGQLQRFFKVYTRLEA